MIEAKCGTKHTQSGPRCCAGSSNASTKEQKMANQTHRVTDYVAIPDFQSRRWLARFPARWASCQFAAAFLSLDERVRKSALLMGHGKTEVMGGFLRCALCSRWIWFQNLTSYDRFLECKTHSPKRIWRISMANHSNHGRGNYAYSKLPPSCFRGGCDRAKLCTYIHTYIVSVTEAALSKLAAIFQFIQFSLAKYSPHTYSLQYPLYCILKSKGVANKAASLVTSWGGKRLLRKSSHVSMITTIGIGDKGEGGFENLVLDAWAHTITKCSEEESSKVHTV